MREDKVARKDYVDALVSGIQMAVDVASKDLDRRLEGMNEFRAQLTTQAEDFLTKDVYESKHQELIIRIERLEGLALSRTAKAQGASLIWKIVVSLIGFIATLALLTNTIRLWSGGL